MTEQQSWLADPTDEGLFDSLFAKIGVIVGLAAAAGAIAQIFRQPLIVAFIAVGIALGPAALVVVEPNGDIEIFARLGISLLLFVVGLKLDLHIIRSVGPVALASGVGQVVFTSAIGFGLALLLGIDVVPAAYVALALTFSSTIIIVKLLSDKREVETLHGRIAVGFLIVQDIIVVLVLIALTALGSADGSDLQRQGFAIALRGVLLIATVALLMRYVLPVLLRRLAHSTELLVLFSIGWAVVGATAGEALGFSKEVGAFLAGISIASTPYRDQVAARLVSLRDFLLLFFFIELGATLDMSTLGNNVGSAAVLSAFVLIGNPFIVMVIMGYMGYRRRTSFLAGLTVAQISEFSLVLAALGAGLGHIDTDTVGLITLVGLVTISVSTYMILYSQQIYARMLPWLGIFERRKPFRELGGADADQRPSLVLIGLGRFGTALAGELGERDCEPVAVDIDPEAVRRFESQGGLARYGDATDPELLASLPLGETVWVVSTLRDTASSRAVLAGLQENGYSGRVALSAAGREEADLLERAGADLVLIPYTHAAHDAADRLAGTPDVALQAAEAGA